MGINTYSLLLKETDNFIQKIRQLAFKEKAAAIYNPLVYAREPYNNYLHLYGGKRKKVLFLGMNPGPWGMAQTGIPFGEITFVKKWLKIKGSIGTPIHQHPKRPITGWGTKRSEVSGRRFWGYMEKRFGTPEDFFREHFVENYCPLVFMEESGRNMTPDKLPKEERNPLFEVCDEHLGKVIEILGPEYLVGVGKFAEKRINKTVENMNWNTLKKPLIFSITHPSPANPRANRNWDKAVEEKMSELGVWKKIPTEAPRRVTTFSS